MFVSHTSELSSHPSRNPGERSYIERVKEAVATAKHVPQQMEQFPAVDESPSIYDGRRVRDCNVYMGIHGLRWGSPVRDQPELSYTEQEYETATAAGIPRLLFLLDPNSSELNLPQEALQDPQFGLRQEAFRQRLLNESGCIVKFFRSPDHLADLVYRSLKELERLSGYREGGRSDWSWPKPWDFRAYRLEKRQGFVGRQWLFEEVRRWAAGESSPAGRAQALLIGADYGVGKSAFLAELIDTGAAGVAIATQHFCSTEQDATLSPSVFVRSMAGQLAEALPSYRQALEADDAKSLRDVLDQADQSQDPQKAFLAFDQAVLAPLLAIEAPPSPMLLVVDAIDEALDPRSTGRTATPATIVQLLARYANRLPPWLKLLATSRRRPDVMKALRQGFVLKELDAEEGQNLDDLLDYSKGRCGTQPLEGLINATGLSTSEVAEFLSTKEQSRGKFLYVVRVLKDLETGLLPLASREDLERLPPGLDGFYGDAFERRFPTEESYALVRDILGVLCEAREPIGRRELAAILQRNEREIGVSLLPLHDLLRLQPVAVECDGVSVKEVLHSFDHASLAQWLSEEDEWLMQRAGRFAVDRAEAAARIRAWSLAEVAAQRAHTWDFLVRHLLDYLPDVQRRAVQSELLGRFSWLDARLRLVGINALLEDFEHAEPTGSAIEIRNFIRQSRQALFLSRTGETEHFASQILSRLPLSTQFAEIKSLRKCAAIFLKDNNKTLPIDSSLTQTRQLLEEISVDWLRSIAEVAGEKIVIGNRTGSIDLWDIRLGKSVGSTKCEGRSTGIVAAVDHLCIAVAVDNNIQIWNSDLSRCDALLEGHTAEITTLLHIGGDKLASSSKDGTVRIWDTRNQVNSEVIQNNSLHVAVIGMAGADCIVITDINKIFIWNHVSREFLAWFQAEGYSIHHVSKLEGSRFLCHIDNEIRVWDANISAWSDSILQGIKKIARIADKRYAVVSSSGFLSFWDYENKVSVPFAKVGPGVFSLMPLGSHLLTLCQTLTGFDFSIRIYNMRIVHSDINGVEGHCIDALAISNGRILTGSRFDDTIYCYDPMTREVNTSFAGHWSYVAMLSAMGGRLWQEETKSTNLLKNASWHGACLLLHDGRIIYQLGKDGSPFIWDPFNAERKRISMNTDDTVTALAQNSYGLVALGTWKAKLYLWNDSEGLRLVDLVGHSDRINSIEAIGSNCFATGSSDRTIRLWKIGRYSSESTIAFIADSPIMTIAFYEPLTLLMAGDASGRLHWLKLPESLSA